MDKVGSLTQVLAALRKQLNNSTQQVSKSDKGQKAARKKRLSHKDRDNTLPLEQVLVERIGRLPSDSNPRDLRKAFIETVLTRELEMELSNDEEFDQIIDNISAQIENNKCLKDKFETLIKQLKQHKK